MATFIKDTPQPGVTYGGMPPELQQEASQIARRRMISEAMLGQALQPIKQQEVSGRVVPIGLGEGIAKIAQAYLGAQNLRTADQGSTALAGKYQAGLRGAMEKFRSTAQGTGPTPTGYEGTQVPGTSETDGGPVPGVPGDRVKAALEAMSSGYGPVEHVGTSTYADEMKQSDPFSIGPGHRRYSGSGNLIATAPDLPQHDKSIPADWKKHLPEGAKAGPTPGTYVASDGDTMQMKFEGGQLVDTHNVNPMPRVQVLSPPQQTVRSIQDPLHPEQNIDVDSRTFNEEKYKGGNKTGYIGISPKLGDVQKANLKKQLANVGVGDAITKAREILTGTGGSAGNELPTASGLGSHVDTVGGFFGYTPKGAKSAAELKVVGGSLVSKVPRFEGPQSNFDLAHYKAVAGKIGDETVPIDIRLKALDRVEEIWGQFEAGKKNGFTQLQGPGGLPSNQTDKGPIGALTPAEQAELAALKKKHGR